MVPKVQTTRTLINSNLNTLCTIFLLVNTLLSSFCSATAHRDVSSTSGQIESDLLHLQEFILSDNWDAIGCLWDGTGSGDPYKMAVECAQYSEDECHPDPEENGMKERRCIWRERVHGNAPLEEELSDGPEEALSDIMHMKVLAVVALLSVAFAIVVAVTCSRFYRWWKGRGPALSQMGGAEQYREEEDTSPLLYK